MTPILDREAFIRAQTRLTPVPHAPEISLYLADEATELWRKTEEELGEIGLPPPFWAFAWAGGQALARYLLDHPKIVAGRAVIDFASGSGIVAVAAKKAGAARVLAADIDPFCESAVTLNAAANGVALEFTSEDLLDRPPPPWARVILAGDICYEKPLAERVMAWLRAAKSAGATVLIGDPGRSYLPKSALTHVIDYNVPVTRELEDSEVKRTAVWRL